jgi:hypothetical protein
MMAPSRHLDRYTSETVDACQNNPRRVRATMIFTKISEALRKLADTEAREDQGVTLAICIIVATLAGFVGGWSLRSHYILRFTTRELK